MLNALAGIQMETLMKVIFLDIDGVLNVISQGHDEFGSLFHKHFEDNLRRIIEQTGAKIVISSTWRMSGLEKMQAMWKHRDLAGEVIDVSPDCTQLVTYGTFEYYDAVERGHEIQDWLDKHPEVTNYVITDDDADMLKSQRLHFVRCANNRTHEDCVDIGYGLTKKCAEEAIEILNDVTLTEPSGSHCI